MSTSNSRHVIIVAGGSGIRMGNKIPKQFLLLAGQPVLFHTINAFYNFDNSIHIVLVLPHKHIAYWHQLVKDHHFSVPVTVVEGGPTRFQSVKNGLSHLPEYGTIAIHDGVRPLIDKQTISSCFEMASKFGSAIPVTEITESVRMVEGETNSHFDRSKIKKVQTPQVFKASMLQNAYLRGYSELFTDDASVVEAAGFAIHLSQGNAENIKITTPVDLLYAEAVIKSWNS